MVTPIGGPSDNGIMTFLNCVFLFFHRDGTWKRCGVLTRRRYSPSPPHFSPKCTRWSVGENGLCFLQFHVTSSYNEKLSEYTWVGSSNTYSSLLQYFSLLPSRTDLTCSDQEEFRQRELRAARLAMEIESQNMVSNYRRRGGSRGDAVCLCVFCRIDMASMTQGLKRKCKRHHSPSLFLLLSLNVIELFSLYSRFSAVVRPPAVMAPPSLPQEYVLR